MWRLISSSAIESGGGNADDNTQSRKRICRRASAPSLTTVSERTSSKVFHQNSQGRCSQLLQTLRQRKERIANGERKTEEAEDADLDLEEELEALLWYKNRYVDGTLLHHAVWKAKEDQEPTAATVRLVLSAGVNIHAKARYTKDEKENQLEVIHIAAGVGSVAALDALAEQVGDDEALSAWVNQYCQIDGQNFYTPIIEAAYCGHPQAVSWLLEHRADPNSQNRDGWTPMHWLAKKGLESESELEEMVRSLLKRSARLDSRTKLEDNLPLQLAAADDSHFPRRMLYLLAPSLQGTRISGGSGVRRSVFDDLCLLSGDAASHLARHLLDSGDASSYGKVHADAQGDNAVDRMANLLHTAPQAAADVLQILVVKPQVKDSGRHAIPTRARLGNFFVGAPMRCAYRHDASSKAGSEGLLWPDWRYNSEIKDDRQLSNQPELAWHLTLVPAPDIKDERREGIDDVDTKVVLLPNLLDIDIFMALACTQVAHSSIFAKLSVQGAVHCLWDHLIVNTLHTSLLFNCVELVVLAYWGLTNFPGVAQEARDESGDVNSPMAAPVCLAVLLAGLIRDSLDLGWWFCEYLRKWNSHLRCFRAWEEKKQAKHVRNAELEDSQAVHVDSRAAPPSLHSLWHPKRFVTGIVVCELVHCSIRTAFACSGLDLGHGRMSDWQQALLMTATMMQFVKTAHSLRLMTFGKKINTISRTFSSSSILEMLLIMSLFFASVLKALGMLKRDHATAWISIYLYKGLLFGDGEALDYLGLDPKHQSDTTSVKTVLMLVASFIFNVVILNLIIAAFGSEYERAEKDSGLLFQQERARHCCRALLSLQKFPYKGDACGIAWLQGLAAGILAVALALGAAMHTGGDGQASIWAFQAPASSPWAASTLLAALLALGQEMVQAYLMASPWFLRRGCGNEGPEQEHFLWICHRADYSERADDEERQQLLYELQELLDPQFDKLEERNEQRVGRVEQKFAKLDEKVEKLTLMSAEVNQRLGNLDRNMEALVDILGVEPKPLPSPTLR